MVTVVTWSSQRTLSAKVSHSTQKGLRWTCLHYSKGMGSAICGTQYFMNFRVLINIFHIWCIKFFFFFFLRSAAFIGSQLSSVHTAFKREYSIGETVVRTLASHKHKCADLYVCAYEMNCFFKTWFIP